MMLTVDSALTDLAMEAGVVPLVAFVLDLLRSRHEGLQNLDIAFQ